MPLGRRGELLAEKYVRETLGFKVIGRNVRCLKGELDLVAVEGRDVVFIEVRTRATERFGAPERTIRSKKRRDLIKAARYYIQTRRMGESNPRFDTIAIVMGGTGEPVIRHRRNAFPMSGR